MTSANTAASGSRQSAGGRNPFRGMRRFPDRGYIAGVCEGIALHFDWSARLVRIIALLLLFFTGFWPAVVAYVIAWIVLDRGDFVTAQAESEARTTALGTRTRLESLEQRLRALEAYVTSEEFRLRRALRELND